MSADYKEIERLMKSVSEVTNDVDSIMVSCTKEIGARTLRGAIKRTPVGKLHGGTLRRGWGSTNSLDVNKNGNEYSVEIINPVEYASYVEHGHRTKSGGWVKGRFMLTLTENEMRRAMKPIIENRVAKELERIMK